MCHVVIMQSINAPQNRPRQVLQSEFGKCTNRLDQVMKTSIRCEVAYNGDTPFRTVPESVEDADVGLGRAVSLPVPHPSFEHLSNLSIADWHLLDAIYFQAGTMKHLFYRT